MHCCKFCLSDYVARPQVKNPRACQKPQCQQLRQRANEREWRQRHPEYPGANYYSASRKQRTRRIQAIATALRKCLQVGVDLTGLNVGVAVFSETLEDFLLGLGVRQINKFWAPGNVGDFKSLDAILSQNFVQTS